ncbi:hypothetical protein [Ursidibacter arcticus]
MKFVKKLRKRWQLWQFQQQKPVIAERHHYLKQAIQQGNQHPVGRAKRGRYD